MNLKTMKEKLHNNINQVMVGCDEQIDYILIALLVGGHILLEDVPGTGKTTLAKTFAQSLECDFNRIQFTPDLLPSDLTGVSIYLQNEGTFTFRKGPIFTQILLADEINRAAPRTQSSMLEAMEEKQVSVDGETFALPNPFLVIATQNPIESAGTFPLPEAQIDRFLMRLSMGYPTHEEEIKMLKGHANTSPLSSIHAIITSKEFLEIKDSWQEVIFSEALYEYLMEIVEATRTHEKIALGISPRATLSMVKCCKAYAALDSRDYVLPDDIKACIHPVFDHRIQVSGASYTKSSNTTLILDEILETIPVPVEDFNRNE